MQPPSFQPDEFHREHEARLRTLDKTFPGARFSDRVRQALYRFALIRNSWGTTNLDSGPISLDRVSDLYRRYEKGVAPAGRIPPSDREVLNYFALIADLPTSHFDLSADDVQDLHRDYFRGVPLDNEARPGQWKARDVVIRGPYGTVRTTPWQEIPGEVARLLAWLNHEGQDLPTHVRAAVFFHRFQAIHPFQD